MAAAAAGNPESVRVLLKTGAQVNAKNQRRQTALLSAASGDDGFAIGELGRRRAKIPNELVHRDVVVRMLLDAGADINACGWDGETGLFSLEDDAVEELLRHHINLEIRDEHGETALIETVSDRIAALLIKAGQTSMPKTIRERRLSFWLPNATISTRYAFSRQPPELVWTIEVGTARLP